MDHLTNLKDWMTTEGRCSDDPVKVVSYFCSTLADAGVPIWRVNIAQSFANPLFAATGIVWKPEEIEVNEITHAVRQTDSYLGSSFEYIFKHKKPLHKNLRNLNRETEHLSYVEFADQGGTDYYATLLQYGDASLHGCTFLTRDPKGFQLRHLEMIEAALPALSSALEPITMRKSSKSLLRAYLGDGPSDAVWHGTIMRGERTTIEAVVMISDLRGFTALSDSTTEDCVFEALNGYFDAVVQSVEGHGGDVLKFIGDGTLSIFPISDNADRAHQCRQATLAAKDALAGLAALNATRAEEDQPILDIGIGISFGQVSYGNIGSPGRLDFTVLGGAVNVASRIEALTKTVGNRVLATAAVAHSVPELYSSCGIHAIRGISAPLEVFTPFDGHKALDDTASREGRSAMTRPAPSS